MTLRHLGFVELPPHAGAGGFDHAAVHEPLSHRAAVFEDRSL